MTSVQLSMFIELTKNLSFSKTAEIFYTTQPTVSRQIGMLEEEWGVKLFDRNRRTVKVTRAGLLLADICAENKKALEKGLKQAKRYKK